MLKKRYAALMIVISLIGGAACLSLSLVPRALSSGASANDTASPARSDGQTIQLSQTESEEIALDSANLTREQVVMERTELDCEKGQPVWEVEFYCGNTEYDFEIHAYTGEILQKKQEQEKIRGAEPVPAADPTAEPVTAPESASAPAQTELSAEDAVAIALADAGLTADEAVCLQAEKDREDGVWVYEIEFRQGKTEYEYEIRADDGAITERDIEWDD